MKKVLDDNIINNIINIEVFLGNDLKFIAPICKSYINYQSAISALIFLKKNIALSCFFIPVIILEYIYDIYKQSKYNMKKFYIYRKKLSLQIKQLEENDINLNKDSLLNAILYKDKENNSINIICYDNNGSTKILKQQKVGNKKWQILLLNENETVEFLKNNPNLEDNITLSLLKRRKKKIANFKNMKYIRTIVKLLSLNLLIYFAPIAKNTFDNYSFENNRSKQIIDYYDNNDSLENRAEILSYIEKEVTKVCDDDKFRADNVVSKEELDNYLLLNAIIQNDYANKKEKTVLYNFIDFFEDNSSLDYKKTYNNLENLEFDRYYNFLSKGIKNEENNTVTAAYYVDNTITYCTTPDERLICHECVHAIFDTKNIPTAYVEGLAELIENEYFTEEDNFDYDAYNKNVAITKATIELIGKDKFLESINKDNVGIIRTALAEVYIANNSDSNTKEAFEEVDELLELLDESLVDKKNYIKIASMLVNFLNDDMDIEKINRFLDYINTLFYKETYISSTYYHFNDEKIKTLNKD